MKLIVQGKTNWRFLIIVAVLAAVLGGGILLYTANQKISITQPSKMKELNKTTDWKLFNNTKYNYSFSYPPETMVTTEFNEIPGGAEQSDRIIVLTINKESIFNVQVRNSEMYLNAPPESKYKDIVNLDLKTFTERIWDYNKYIEKSPFLTEEKKVGEISKTTINGKDAYQFSLSASYDDWEGGYVLEQTYLYTFITDEKGNKFVIWFPLDNKMAPQILESFKLEIIEGKIDQISVPNFIDNKPTTIINAIMQSINNPSSSIKFSNPKELFQWWVSDDGWNILISNAVSITAQNNDFYSLSSLANDLNNEISKIFLYNNFELNNINTSKSVTDNEFYDYVIAFQKNENRCTLTTNGDGGEYSVACSNSFQDAYKEQIPYLKALNNKNVVVGIREKIGDFVWLNVHGRRTGYEALVKDKDGEITLIFTGQEAPPCNKMIINNVPKEVYGECYDSSGNITK